MKKHLILLLLITLIAVTVIGCGQSGEGGGPTPDPNQLTISSTYPSSGAQWTTTEGFIINFNNQINTSKLNLSKIYYASDHNAGTPQPSFEVTWLLSNKSIKLTPKQGWSNFELVSDPPVKVHLLDSGAFEDVYGNKLTSGETIANHYIANELWRWFPLKVGGQIKYNVSRSTHSSYYLTYETWTIRDNSAFSGYISIDAYAIFNTGYSGNFGYYSAISNDSVIRNTLVPFYPPTLLDAVLLFASTLEAVGSNWTESLIINDTPPQAMTVEGTVVSNDDTTFILGTYNAYKINLQGVTLEGTPPLNFMNFYFVYNKGILRREIYNGTGTLITETAEASYLYLP